MKNEKASLERTLQTVEQDHRVALRKLADDSEKKLQVLRDEKEKLTTEISALKTERADTNQRIDSFKMDEQKNSKRITSLCSERDACNTEINSLKTEIAVKDREIAQMKTSNEELLKSAVTLKIDLSALRNESELQVHKIALLKESSDSTMRDIGIVVKERE